MLGGADRGAVTLSVVVPCYNEEATLRRCVENVLAIGDDTLSLEILIVDDCSSDRSPSIAEALAQKHPEIRFLTHARNQGKGAALRTGFREAAGDIVAVQDADLEYDPRDLRQLIVPIVQDDADVVIGSRFLGGSPHRVLYFWHSLGNRALTFLSNMFTDLNLTDMESCYKVFRRDVIQAIPIREDRFGFEPEIVAKVAQRGLRIFEMGISYRGRTYAEGKKIGWRDAFRTLYCIVRYNAPRAPVPIQFVFYTLVSAIAAAVNLVLFVALLSMRIDVNVAAPVAFVVAAAVNYLLCISLLFRHRARWDPARELLAYAVVVALSAILDLEITKAFLAMSWSPGGAKIMASGLVLIANFLGRRFLVFPEPAASSWTPQERR